MKKLIIIILVIFPTLVFSQVTEDFSDGDFTANPVWSGDDSEFEIDANRLNSNGPSSTAELYISTPSTIANNTTWEFNVDMQFAPSGSNKVRIYLMSDQANLESSLNGYFIQVGETSNDEIRFFRQDLDNTETELFVGSSSLSGNLNISYQITRDASGNWQINADVAGGTTYVSEGASFLDNTYTTTTHFGFVCFHTTGRRDLFFFDDISISAAASAIAVNSATVESSTSIRVKFNQNVDQTSSELTSNYTIDNSIIVSSAARDLTNLDEVVLTVSTLATNSYQLTISNVEDDDTNTALAAPEVKAFNYTQLALLSLVTNSETEIQLTFNDNVDKTSAENIANYSIDNSIGSPSTAVMNAGDNKIVTLTLSSNLQPLTNYTLTYGSINNSSGNSSIVGGNTEAFSYVIPLVVSSITVLSKTEIELEFNLNLDQTTAETITNYSIDNSIGNPSSVVQSTTELNKVTLTLGTDLTENTYTIIMNNVADAANNAIAANSTTMFAYLPIVVSSVSTVNNTEIEITFNQNMDQSTAEALSNYSISGEIGTPATATLNSGDNSKVILTFTTELVNNNYEVTINGVNNTSGNATTSSLTGAFSFQAATDYRTIVINEIFADPSGSTPPNPVVLPTGSSDEFVELYNVGTRSINIENFDLSGGTIGAFVLAPNAYVILTATSNTGDFAAFGDVMGVTSWNGLSNGGEKLTLKDNLGNLVDSLTYNTNWYHDTDKDDGAWTIEQINPELSCGAYEGNWASSTDNKGGTPGAQNSIFNNSADVSGPNVIDISALNQNTIRLTFNEPMDGNSLTGGTYAFDNGLTQTSITTVLGLLSVDVDVNNTLVSGTTYQATITGVKDCSGNSISTNVISLDYDILAPTINRVIVKSLTEIQVLFDEALTESIAEKESNFSVNNSIGNPSSAILDTDNNQDVTLKFSTALVPEQTNTLTITNLEDLSNNAIVGNLDFDFTYTQDIDTTLALGVNLLDVNFNTDLEETAAETLSNYFVSGGAGNPVLATLDNGDKKLVHLVFNKDFDENTNLILTVENQKSTSNTFLSTPEYTFIYDTKAPELSLLTVQDSKKILLTFNETLEQTAANTINNFVYNSIFPSSAELQTDKKSVLLTFEKDFNQEEFFTLEISGLRDVFNNILSKSINTTFVYDVFPPKVDSLIVLSPTTLVLVFNEDVEKTSTETLTNYTLDNAIGNPTTATQNLEFKNQTTLEFGTVIPTMDGIKLSINNVKDIRSNVISTPQEVSFDYGKISVGNIKTVSNNNLKVVFSKTPIAALATDVTNYKVNGIAVSQAMVDAANDRTYNLTLSKSIEDNSNDTLRVENITDLASNGLDKNEFFFEFKSQFKQYELISNNTIDIEFNVNLNATAATTLTNYNISPAIGTPAVATLDNNKVRLVFASDLAFDTNYTLSWSNISNEFNNELPNYFIQFKIDNSAPLASLAKATFNNLLSLKFDEALKESTAENESLFFVNNNIGNPKLATYNSKDSTVLLEFSNTFSESINYIINIDRVEDLSANQINNQQLSFSYTAPLMPEASELIITEIMANPSPVIGLPEQEYIEIYNNSTKTFNLSVVNLSDNTNTVNLGNKDIASGEYLILTSDASAFAGFENVFDVSGFPTLTNSGETISLSNMNSVILDKVTFETNFYRDNAKDDGGYSLERIFFAEQCVLSLNWIASTDASGGTPGKENSVLNVNFDTTAPEVTSVGLFGTNGLIIHFNEVLDSLSLKNGTYTFTNGLAIQDVVVSDAGVDSIQVNFTTNIEAGIIYEVTISNISDCSSNTILEVTKDFGIGKTPLYGDLLFTEIMPDPSPVIGLPEEEFIEIYNTSSSLINLEGIQLADASDTTTLVSYNLLPNSYLILSSTANTNDFSAFGNSLGVSSFPSLGNTVDSLYLFLDDNTLIDQLFYTPDFYRNNAKDDGGYSLERIFFDEQCVQSLNWIASSDASGGTPGKENSVLNVNFDSTSPEITAVNLSGTNGITIHFDEVLDSLSLKNGTYSFTNGLIIQDIVASNAGVDSVLINFTTDIEAGIIYEVTISNVSDCYSNKIVEVTKDFGIGKTPVYGDLLFTEIMPDPSPVIGLLEEEFIEIYNTSSSLINLEGIQLADASDTTTLGSYDLLPNSYLILASAANTNDFSAFGNTLGVSSFPSLGNTVDSLYLFLNDNTLIDQLFYTSDFYRDNSKDDGGYSLERIFFAEQCVQSLNWIASTDANGGTPGKENSVFNINFDSTAPEITAVNLNGTNGITIHFDEVLDSLSLKNGTYSFTNGLVIQDIIVSDAGVDSVLINFTTDIEAGIIYEVTISNVSDCSSNTILEVTKDFGIGKTPVYGDLLFTEIMPDPSPVVGLPEEEFIEIYNTSSSLINLEGIQLADASDTTILDSYNLLPNSYLILSSTANTSDFSAFGNTLGVSSFPSLGNTVDSLYLFLDDNTLIDQLFYTSDFYRDNAKDDGGYSLERIFFAEQCVQSLNWIASTDASGGTPGKENSVFNVNFDSTAPEITAVNLSGTNGITIHFDEVLDSLSLKNGTYSFTNALVIQDIVASNAGVDSVLINFTTDIEAGIIYEVTISNVSDCSSNTILEVTKDFGIGKTPVYGDLLFTEIMPDPSPVVGLPEEEFIEIYNTSSSLINLEGIQLADASDTTILDSYNLLPNSYLILSSTANTSDFSAFGNSLGVSSFPSLGNTVDSLYLFLNDNTLLDQLFYSSSFYRDDSKDDGGYSLERIFFAEQCVQSLNWIASTDASGGTPGKENSVFNGIIDTELPKFLSFEIIKKLSLKVLFNEPMDSLSLVEGTYAITGDIALGGLSGITKGGQEVVLNFATEFDAGIIYNVEISNISDCSGNVINPFNIEFGFSEKPKFNELIITEIMADPDADAGSSVSLPAVEYLELYNTTNKSLDLSELTVQDGTSQTTLNPYILPSQQYVLLVPRGSESLYADKPVLSVSSWPSLNNGGEVLAIFNQNTLVFSLTYSSEWYKDSDKTGGGYSLEMIDPKNPCGDINNWSASNDVRGGTPGEVNSVDADNPDNFGPQLIEAIVSNETELHLVFNEKLSPSSIFNGLVTLDPDISISAILNDTLEIKSLRAQLSSSLSTNQTYTIKADGFSDCLGNIIDTDNNSTTFLLPEAANEKDVILNEILFNPRSGGTDFVEIYNNSTKAINLKKWQVSSIDDDGTLIPKTITNNDVVINPSEYKVLTTDFAKVKDHYPAANEATFLLVSTLSSMPNDEGTVIILDSLENQIDRFDYSADFHFNLLDDVKGVSLERINFNAETNNANSWQSAASTAGFATPGLANSQFKTETQTTGTLTVEPKVFVPDNTGMDNFTTINYDLKNSGSFANILIYNHRGKLTKTIAQGDLLSTTGFFTWDGTNNAGERASFGYYVIYFEIYDSSGNTEVMKETIVLGTRF